MLNKWMGIVPDASEHGHLVDHTLEFCHWFMLLLFVGWFSFFIYTIFRFHRSRNPRADYHGVRSHFSTHLELTVVMVEAVLLLGFGLPLWGNRVTGEAFPDRDKALNVHAIGEQFKWNFHYPGPDGKFCRRNLFLVDGTNPLGLDYSDPDGEDDIISPNELHLANYRPTIIEITSKDVIHSFSLHSMRITQDATPGSMVPVWFRPKKEGKYEIVCAQLCGAGHYAMRADMMVEDVKTFDAWYEDSLKTKRQNAKPAAPATPAAAAPGTPAPAPAAH